MGTREQFGVEEEVEHMGGGLLLCEHKDQKSTEEKERAGREEDLGL